MSASSEDTIVAIATPAGEGAIGIVRLSGADALHIASSHVSLSVPLQQVQNFHIRFGQLLLDGQPKDELLIFVARAPNSYTGEDTVEFQCHGSPVLLNGLVRSLIATGARQAEPGEFAKRAFLSGRIDLTQAEAVADLISAKTDFGLDSAFFQLRGGLKDRFVGLSEELRQTKTLIEAVLDFSEDVTVDPERVRRQLHQAMQLLSDQIESYRSGKLIRAGARVVLCGRPNVGKSSLMNVLLGENRAIVTATEGTTRDTIEETVEVGGVIINLIDTAGIRETGDEVEKEGTRRSGLAIEAADLVLVVCDQSTPPTIEDSTLLNSHPEAILVLNKHDLGEDASWSDPLVGRPSIRVSAITGEGMEGLRSRLRDELLQGEEINSEIITNERHFIALRQARHALERTLEAVDQGAPGEVVSFELDEGLSALALVIGETVAQDILDKIFSQFCIGK